MKKAFLLFFIVNMFFSSYSLNKFDIRIANIEDEKATSIIEFQNFYIILGYIKKGASFGNYLVKLDKQGNLIEDTIIYMGTLNLCAVKLDDNFAVFRSNSSTYPSNISFEYTLFDTSLNVIYNKSLKLPDSLSASRYYVEMNKDSSFIISGVLNKHTATQPVNLSPFIYKVSPTGDSLKLVVLTSLSSNSRLSNVRKVSARYYAFMSFFESSTEGSILVLDNNLSILDTLSIPNQLYDHYSALIISDSTFLIFTIKTGSHLLYLSIIDTSGNILSSKPYGDPLIGKYPAYQNSLSKKGNNIFCVYNVNFPLTNPFFGNGRSSNIQIKKVDKNLNTIWSKRNGGDAFYHVYNVLATNDGGCIVIGNLNDTINHNLNRDIFVMKYNSNGLITWTKDIKLPSSKIMVFPNPSSRELNIKLSNGNQRLLNYRIYNLQGKLILQNSINSLQTKIDIQNLASGVYIIETQTNSGAIYQTKFVRE